MAALGHHNALVQHIRRTLYQSKFCWQQSMNVWELFTTKVIIINYFQNDGVCLHYYKHVN